MGFPVLVPRNIGVKKSSFNAHGRLTIRRNNAPTVSVPCPPSTADPSAISISSVSISVNKAISVMLPNIIFASSCVIGRPKDADESDAVDCVRDEDPEESGGVAGFESGAVRPEMTFVRRACHKSRKKKERVQNSSMSAFLINV